MFDIVIDYPDSTPALHDLKVSQLDTSTLDSYDSFTDILGYVGMPTACRSAWPACTGVA